MEIRTRCALSVHPCRGERAQRNFQTVLASLRGHRVERVLLVIVEKASQRAIGISAFQDFDVRRRRVEAGMMLGCGSCGRGFGKEGLSALVTHAFARFPVDEVWIQHAADNSSAKRVPVSLGLSHNTTAAYDDGSGRFIWSAYRESWCQQFPGRIEVSDQCQM